MRCLVSGASGFLGGAVAEAARKAGHDVRTIGRPEFSSAEALAAAVREASPDCVLHFAGTASVGGSFAAPWEDFESSTALWFRLLDAIRRSECRPLVTVASSAAVYGSPETLPTPETAARRPESPYGFHKLFSEQAGEEFARCFGLSVVALRYFSVFGPRQRRLLVWEIFEQLRSGAPEVRLKGTGDECRDYLAEEAASAVTVDLVTALAREPRRAAFQAFNVASGASVSVRQMAEALRACAGSDAPIVFDGRNPPGNPARWQADVSRLRAALPDWQPPLTAGSLARCVAAWRDGNKIL